MKISSIPQIYRNVNRWGEILSVLSKYGLANWVSRLDLEFAKPFFKDPGGEVLARQSPKPDPPGLRAAPRRLGQILSREPTCGSSGHRMQKLQDEAPADPPKVVRPIIEAELGQPIEELFAEFEDQPLASASIGQVHKARLRSGERVVVKVQHARIEERMRVDLDILMGMAQLAERIPEFENYRPRAAVAEIQRTVRRELDFGREERNMQQFSHDFGRDPNVRIPKSHPDLCTGRVLTMEFLDGVRLVDQQRLLAGGFDLEEVARRGAELYLRMIFSNGYYHADPHPGNIMLLPGTAGLLTRHGHSDR
jgi:ubiquinone biosynthesis protein